MENAEAILVIILAVFLAIFLLLAIVLLIKCIQIANKVQALTEKAEKIVDKAESVGEFLQRASGSLAVGGIVQRVVSMIFTRGEKQKRRRR